jgi:hypothetical protein
MPTQRRSHHAKKGIQIVNSTSSTNLSTNGTGKSQNSAQPSTLPYPELENVKLQSEPSEPTTMKSQAVQKKGTGTAGASGGRDKYKKLNDLIISQVGGMGLGMMQVPFLRKDGVILFGHCQKLADNMVNCAKVNEGLYKLLMAVFSGAVYTALIMECAAITGSIMSNHNVQIPLPAGLKERLAGGPDTSSYSFMDALTDGMKLAAILNSPQQELDVNALLAAASAQTPT